jgi:hypothetical protein
MKKSMFFSKKIKQFKIAQTAIFTGKGRHIPLVPRPISPLPNLQLDRGVKTLFLLLFQK